MELKKAVFVQKVNKNTKWTSKNQIKRLKWKIRNQLILQQNISDVSRDTQGLANIDSIKLPGETGRIKKQQQGNNILFEQESERIGNDFWKQLKRFFISIFDGDRRRMETGNLNSQPAYIDHALATTEYRLLQLQRYPCGDALK